MSHDNINSIEVVDVPLSDEYPASIEEASINIEERGISMNRLLEKSINDFNLIDEDDKIVVGLSGGADSIMLTHYLKFALKMDVVACHINHNLRGDESQRDMEFVKTMCDEWNIPLSIHSVDITQYAQKNKITIEQAGRQIRYEVFELTAKEYDAQKIATAHTLSDNAETVMFNLTRGTGLKGLCGIPPRRGNIIRPLIYLTRRDIENYCSEHSLKYVIDSTNLKTVYTRNKIRHEVLPKLHEVNPQLFTAVNRTIGVLSNEQDYMHNEALDAYEKVKKSDGLSIERLQQYHIAIRHRVLSLFLEDNNLDRTNELIARLDKIVLIEKGKLNVKGDIYVEVKKHTLILFDNKQILDYFEQPLEIGEYFSQNGQQYTISLCNQDEINTIKKVYKKLLYICLDYDKIIGKLMIRSRKAGDKISLVERAGSRSLKRLFIDDKLTPPQKSQLLVIADDKSVVAVENYGEDKRVAIDENTKRILVIIRK